MLFPVRRPTRSADTLSPRPDDEIFVEDDGRERVVDTTMTGDGLGDGRFVGACAYAVRIYAYTRAVRAHDNR